MDLRTRAVQGVAAGIGLVSESVSAHKARKQKAARQRDSGSSSPVDREEAIGEEQREVDECHELQWELDEVQDQLCGRPESTSTVITDEDTVNGDTDTISLAESFARNYPPPSYTETPQLPCPVVLPQRRPKSQMRGFIRAYSPVLQDFGIDESMFLEFLETSNKACQASPWIQAVNLASIGTMFMPTLTGFLVSAAIQIATNMAMAAEGRRKTNAYFDKINDSFFRPRGLYCLIMTWNPESADPYATFNLNSTVMTAMDRGGSDMFGKLRHKFKTANADTYGNLPFPETAPLVFPVLDQLPDDEEIQKKLSKLKKQKQFASDYWDRRARAKFALENPDSELNMGPKPIFTSRYADPSHPASSGSLLGLVTGGYLTEEKLSNLKGRGTLSQLTASRGSGGSAPYGQRGGGLGDLVSTITSLKNGRGISSSSAINTKPSLSSRVSGGLGGGLTGVSPLGFVQKVLKKKVVYLMIVNMPSEEEMQAAREALSL
ncbi:hypothetical protein ASPZODRAFT_58063 [Penicilliopsis zonata CBS 506.65]|uniref:Uncharacterized protein n=1 Tax=Penicilliopsis zonata CBS 506.65 TaxID=1073090 RepID=A0A1L9ST26_9EURO|nr:hypothetical protein ASPZODRAFT_58063 [Penicilliopsis zonata CBS 506.65]OJJ50359.1 hypothetical protein ASPZODRAFT_58063 [Penicilliopsis zonata CBS 506.65]